MWVVASLVRTERPDTLTNAAGAKEPTCLGSLSGRRVGWGWTKGGGVRIVHYVLNEGNVLNVTDTATLPPPGHRT